jgi:hypothetical protein
MRRELKIDHGIYLIDDSTRTYLFLRSNPEWKEMTAKENEYNKRQIDGYFRVMKDGTKREFHFKGSVRVEAV